MIHGSVSSSFSKGVISFVDYAPRKKKETEIIWTMNEFLRRTEKLVLTMIAAIYLENEFNYLHLNVLGKRDSLIGMSSGLKTFRDLKT
jgi:hypothetical protein